MTQRAGFSFPTGALLRLYCQFESTCVMPPTMEASGRDDSAPLTLAGFEPHGFFNGEPYRLEADGVIYAVRAGEVVRFGDFDAFVKVPQRARSWWPLPALLALHGVAICISLIVVQYYYRYLPIVHFEPAMLVRAAVNVLPSLALLPLLAWWRASFGYALSVYLLTISAGYAWLIPFSTFGYDKDLATLSILVSSAAFALPAVCGAFRLPRPRDLSDGAVDRLLTAMIALSGVILLASSTYHFRLVSPFEIYSYRDAVELPKVLSYGCGITIGALLPYAFTLFVARGRWRAAVVAALMLVGFYPVILLKLALLAPAWLVILAILLRFASVKTAVVLSLLLPLLVGIASMAPRLLGFGDGHATAIFTLINWRMLAVPSISLDVYNDFFSRNPLTAFCQISWLKPRMSCPYANQIAEILKQEYQFGMLNASVFATEGIASLGMIAAPLAAFGCGLVVAMANAMSRHWPQRYVFLSAGVVLQSFLSVPFSTMLLTNGAATLFLLWYLTPATYFRRED
ncbi:hypothetical protein [Bradyrhizobium sp. Bra78]|uniref:hypothetical protein n=1 Tax=Bradyrhizobium sp. Bra78 TaxID=2926010 RepID=UPI0021C74052|nr:hypothetical protein [Bradyrhizobium sp. Bra78]